MKKTKSERAQDKRAAIKCSPITVPDAGVSVTLSGTSKDGKPLSKTLRVTQASRAQDWLAYATTDSGHDMEPVKIVGIARAAQDLGYSSCVKAS